MKRSPNMPALRRPLPATAAALGTAALMLAGTSAASAHVEATPDSTAANSYALLTFAIPHGCDTSGTTRMSITLPVELNDAQPTVNPNWTAQKVVEQLPEPKKMADGTSVTKRTSQIIYTAKAPLDPELRDTLVLSVKLPDAAGKTLYFPTLQNCQQGQTDWSQVPQPGQDEEALKAPAPSVTITPAAADGHSAHAAGSAAAPDTAVPTAAVTDDGAGARSWAGLAAGLGGLLLGGLALVRSRTKRGLGAAGSAPDSGRKE